MYLTSAAAAPRSGMDPVGDCAGAGRVAAFFCSSFAGEGMVGDFSATVPPSLAGEGGVGACCRSTASATSRRRIDPPGPLPLMVVRSTPFAFASNSAPSVTST